MRKISKNIVSFLLIAFAIALCSFSSFASQEITDGTYTVSVHLWHSEDDRESMAADALEETAYIVAENGTYTMHIRTGKMTMMLITASLQELYISDGNGNYVDAVVESTDSDGNPTGFYFVLPHTDEYVDVKVNPHIAIMGNRDIGARIKVDYSTLAETSDYIVPVQETTTAETTAAETTTQSTTAAVTTTAPTTAVTTTEITTEITTETVTESVTEAQTAVYEDETTVEETDNDSHKGWIIAVIVLVVIGAVAGIVILIIKKRA
ncbi:MAG: NEAT domain-containing protein [Clostridia bacterium]|nr:NEAT domain-containing protein [Clostridia bacterium]